MAGDGGFSHGVEEEPEQVVEDGGDCAAMGDRWGANVAGVKRVTGVDTFRVTSDAQLVAVRIGWPTTEAMIMMGRQVLAFRRNHREEGRTLLGLGRYGSYGIGCAAHGCFLHMCVIGWWR